MAIDLQAGGHRFDFITGLCMRCKMSRKKFEDSDRPQCKPLSAKPTGLEISNNPQTEADPRPPIMAIDSFQGNQWSNLISFTGWTYTIQRHADVHDVVPDCAAKRAPTTTEPMKQIVSSTIQMVEGD
jgi:hypothetical protein